ncbi:MAG: helix-turn-helix domain-containing protein [Actinobacteria bacterium]|nr:helix-turn-helix domain-containing protein [Actinomycetota bacterium]
MSLFDRTIRERREELGIGQAALAERVGVSQQTISRWEHGEVVPPPKRLVKVAQALDLDLDQMLAYGGYLPTGGGWPHWQQLNMLYEQIDALSVDELLRLIERIVEELRSRNHLEPAEESEAGE